MNSKNMNLNMTIRNFLILILSLFLLSGCGTTKNTVNFTKVRKGEQLDRANEITVEQFLRIWINNSYPVKIDINCHELYKDERFTYFGKNNLKLLSLEPHLFKVRNDSLNLQLGNYNKIDGQIIRQEFWEKIVPKADINTWKNIECTSSSSRPTYTYELKDHKIRIGLHWRIRCDGRKILEKDYNGYYDLNTMKIEE